MTSKLEQLTANISGELKIHKLAIHVRGKNDTSWIEKKRKARGRSVEGKKERFHEVKEQVF